MRILVVGAGGTGGYLGARLAAAGRDVTFLVRPKRAANLRANRLQVISPAGDLDVAPKLIETGGIAGPFDLVMLTVKGFSLDAALGDMAPAVGPGTMILPVLNGMRHMDLLAARFGAAAVIGGVCRVAAILDEQGRVVHLNTLHDLIYGEMDGRTTPRLQAVDAAMAGCGFDARLSDAIAREMWEKWILLATLGGVTCLMRGAIGEIEAAPGGAAFALQFLDEVIGVVRRVGQAPSDAFIAQARGIITAKGSKQTPSMYRDLQQGLPIEADQIIGDLLARAQRAGLVTPLIAAAYAHLAVYQNRLKTA
jgi:2-dehydropantoate 2-reductase